MKLKVVPPASVHVATGNNVTASAAARSDQVLVSNYDVSKETDTSADCIPVAVTSASATDGSQTKTSSTYDEGSSYEGWSGAKSARNPRPKKTVSPDSLENQQVTNYIEQGIYHI